jgi:hypothetical protein
VIPAVEAKFTLSIQLTCLAFLTSGLFQGGPFVSARRELTANKSHGPAKYLGRDTRSSNSKPGQAALPGQIRKAVFSTPVNFLIFMP